MKIKQLLKTAIIGSLITCFAGAGTVYYGNAAFRDALPPGNASIAGNISIIDPAPGGYLVNPANQISENSKILFTYQDIFSGMGVCRAIHYSLAGQKLNYTIGLIQRIIPDIPNTSNAISFWDSEGPHLDYSKITSFDDKTFGLFISGKLPISSSLSVGLNLKPVFHKISNHSAWGAGLDAGMVYRKNDNFGFGLSIINIFPFMKKWNTGSFEIFSPELRGNTSYKYDKIQIHCGLGTILNKWSVVKRNYNYMFGAQFQALQNFTLKMGTSKNSQFSAGFDLVINNYHVEYACLTSDSFNGKLIRHSISIWVEIVSLLNDMEVLNP
ncbi:MAG: hypothetical protein ACE5D7_06420 [Fidelibacterota bacterium]